MLSIWVLILPLLFLYWIGVGASNICWPHRRLQKQLRKQAAREAKRRAADESRSDEEPPIISLESLEEPTRQRRLRRIRNEGLIWLVLGIAGWFKLGCAWALMPSPSVATPPDESRLARQIRTEAESFLVQESLVGLVVAAISDGEEIVIGVGRQDLRSKTPPDGSTLYEIGSITKTFTGILLARQTEDEQITLVTPLQSLLPETAALPEPLRDTINLGHLTTHTSGFPRMPPNASVMGALMHGFFGGDPYANYRESQFEEALRSLETESPPGTRASYSNFGVATLGWALAHRSGQTFEALLREQLTVPLDMSDTVITLDAQQRQRLVEGYRSTLRLGPLMLGLASAHWELPNHWAGAGGLRSTANDMLKYLKANMRITETPLADAIQRSHGRLFRQSEELSFGMNWIRLESNDGPVVIWHNGGTGGFHSFLGFTEDCRHGVVVLTNVSRSIDLLGLRLLDQLTQRTADGD